MVVHHCQYIVYILRYRMQKCKKIKNNVCNTVCTDMDFHPLNMNHFELTVYTVLRKRICSVVKMQFLSVSVRHKLCYDGCWMHVLSSHTWFLYLRISFFSLNLIWLAFATWLWSLIPPPIVTDNNSCTLSQRHRNHSSLCHLSRGTHWCPFIRWKKSQTLYCVHIVQSLWFCLIIWGESKWKHCERNLLTEIW